MVRFSGSSVCVLDGDYKLFCWILGVSRQPFPVDIAKTQTVGDLEKKIAMEQPDLQFGAGDLSIWQVREPFRV